MATTRSALLMSFAQRYSTTLIHFISVIILSRILSPEDIGIYTIGVAVINFAHMFRDFGAPKYVVSVKELTAEKFSTAFGITVAIGWGIAVILALLAQPIADFYSEQGVEAVVYVLALNFMMIPLGAMAPALLKRSMKFEVLLRIRVLEAISNVSVAITLALLGFGYMSMAWGSLAGISVSTLLCWYFLPKEYRLWPRLVAWREVLHFGSFTTLSLSLQEGAKGGADMIVGKLAGFAELGLLSRANGYVDIFRRVAMGAIQPVLFAHLSKQNRGNHDLASSYARAVAYVLGLGVPSFLLMMLLAERLIYILYGDQWLGAVPAAQVLCIAGLVRLLGICNDQLLLAKGKVTAQFRANLVAQPLKILLVFMLVGYGLEGVALALLLGEIVYTVITQVMLAYCIELRTTFWKSSIFASLVVGSMSLPGYFLVDSFEFAGISMRIFELVLIGALSGMGWLLGVYLINHPLKDEITLFFKKKLLFHKT